MTNFPVNQGGHRHPTADVITEAIAGAAWEWGEGKIVARYLTDFFAELDSQAAPAAGAAG